MRERKFVESFNAAIEGFIHALKTERNMRIHFLAAILILLLGIYCNFSTLEMAALCVTITMVLVAEMVNTVIELIIDLVQSEIHPVARIIKDVSAGTVLVTAVNAIIVGYMLFARNIPFNIETAVARLRSSEWHLTFISIIIVFALSVFGKAFFHRGTPLRGGMPSGHSAVAFAMWTVIAFLANNSVVIVLGFSMAFLIARHRIKTGIHVIPEVIAGSVLGVLITTLVFQILR